MIPPVTIQRGNLPPLPHSVGCLVLSRYNGRDILCVKTYLKFIELELPTKYIGTLQCEMKTSKFEITKRIIAIDGKMASFAISCKRKYGLKNYLRSIAPHEGTLCNDSDAYIVTEWGESIRAFPVEFRPLKGKKRFGVYLERGMMEELPKGCPVYNKENKVIGMIKCKNYGILWFVNWFNESKLIKKCEIISTEECSTKYNDIQQYQSIGNLTEQLTKGYEEALIESDTIKDDGTAEIINKAEPYVLESTGKGQRVRMGEGSHSDVIGNLKHQAASMKKQLDIFLKELERVQLSGGIVDAVYSERVEQQNYVPLYDTPIDARGQSNGEALKQEDEEYEDYTVGNVGTDVTNSFTYENIRIDGRLTKSPLTGKKIIEKNVAVLSISNDYVRPDAIDMPIPKRPVWSQKGPAETQRWDNFGLVININDLDQEALFELANELDEKDWERFASEIGVTKDVIQQIKLHQIGWSYAAAEFIANFMTRFPKERLADFRQSVLAIQRHDVVQYMDTKMSGQLMSTLKDVPHQMIEELASKLEMSQFKSIKYWRHLASLYGYDNQSINAMESNFGRHEPSPTRVLFDYLGKSMPHLSVLDIGAALEKLELIRASKKLHDLVSKRIIFRSL